MTSDADGMFTHYYELPADYLHRQQRRQKQITELLALCDDMRGNLHIPSIFVMLSHRWLFDDAAIFSGKLTLARLNLFLKGCNRLFWSDLQQKTVKYRRIYQVHFHSSLCRCLCVRVCVRESVCECCLTTAVCDGNYLISSSHCPRCTSSSNMTF